jgi:NhaP-type Na+/H+ or K+/H+ antiporter
MALTQFIVEQLGAGALVGLAIGLGGGWLIGLARGKEWVARSFQANRSSDAAAAVPGGLRDG